MTRKLIHGFLVTAIVGLAGSQGSAAVWPNNKIWDLQTARLADGTHRVTFKACNGSTCFWWAGINNTIHADNVRALANTAFLTGKRVNLQCGTGTGNAGCSCQNSSVFENNALVNRCVFNIDNMQVIE